MTRRKIQYWVIPSQADGEFVAAMEDVLDVYSHPLYLESTGKPVAP